MTFTVLWVGHEVESYKIASSTNVESGRAYDPPCERIGMTVSYAGNGELYSTPDWPAQNEIWHRFNFNTAFNANMILWAACNAAGTKLAQIVGVVNNGVSQWQFQVNGANVGAPWDYINETARLDVHVLATAQGRIEVYHGPPAAQTKVLDVAGNFSAAASLVRIYHGPNTVNGGFFSTVGHEIVQTFPTLSSTSEIKPPTSQGTDVDGVGDYTLIDEAAFSDADYVVLSAAGQHQSYKSPARTQTNVVVSGITLSVRAWYEAGGPTSIKPYLKIAGTRYYGPAFVLDLIPLGYQYTFATNPATGTLFTTAEANDANLEWGWEAAA